MLRFSLISLTRSLSILAIVLTFLAIAVSKVIPEENGGHRKFAEPRYVGVNGSIFFPPTQENFILDRENGRLSPSFLGSAEQGMDLASFAPWRGENGEIEVAGRLIEQAESNGKGIFVPIGVARGEFPKGKMLDSLECEPMMSGTPCWLPGSRRRIVFPAGGKLYLQEFSDEFEEPSQPRKILSNPAFDGEDRVVFYDVLCPTSPEFGGRLLVSVGFPDRAGRTSMMLPSQIWSIKLDQSRAAVTSAEKMIETEADSGADLLPNVVKTAEGRYVVAFLNRRKSQDAWTLMLAPVEFDALRHIPMAIRSSAIGLESDCAASRPEFSLDGEFVYRIRKSTSPKSTLDRIPVLETLDGAVGAL